MVMRVLNKRFVYLRSNIKVLTLIKFYEARKLIGNRIEIFLFSSFEQNPTVASRNKKQQINSCSKT